MRTAGPAKVFVAVIVAVTAAPIAGQATLPPICVVAVTNDSRASVSVTLDRVTERVAGRHRITKLVTHADGSVTRTTGVGGTTLHFGATWLPNTLKVGAQSMTLGEECAITFEPRTGAEGENVSMPGVTVDVYEPARNDYAPRVIYAQDAHGRLYIAEQRTKHHHFSFDEHGVLVRDTPIDHPS